ncbi:transmembrane protein 145-like isoform X2 [Ischnura elegans]|uniref:transmembrane protein 145-like isoform X2 n=1 Tax=Ischnura elegans TaxID=197161 RepID=UPI001ED8BABF|nr:transmembrane protein 145-like isoform X2 [Ischnura elegans]
MRATFSVVILLLSLKKSECKYVEGHLVTSETWAFVARFCFLSAEGKFEYGLEYDKDYAVQNLLLYYDTIHQWPSVYKTNKSCLEKESVLNIAQNQVINLTTELPKHSGCIESLSGGKSVWVCHNIRSFRSSRERWWFIAFSNCNSTKGLNVRYKFLMTNGPPGDFWSEHFSADEFYILPILMAFSVCYMFMILSVVIFAVELRSRQLLHTTYKIYTFSVVLQGWGVSMLSIAVVQFAHDGVGFPSVKTFGQMLESGSEISFLLVLLLLAKGYTVTRGRLKASGAAKLAVFMTFCSITHACLFLYQSMFFDPGEVLYLYESPPGYGLIFLRLMAWWMFVYSIVFTLKHYPEKSPFYYPFNLVGTIWFVAGPIFIIIANNCIDKWVRETVVCAVEHAIIFGGHMMFLILTRPSRANKNFPYHVRTTQVGVMEELEITFGGAAENCLDHFSHHPYAPSTVPLALSAPCPQYPAPDWMTNVPVELFSVSRAVAVNPNVTNGFLTQPPTESVNEGEQTRENHIITRESLNNLRAA